ncbi:MAG: penicillin-binding protein 2 [Eggerthellaceae bacterium]|nr:penicillin-binding protein 2 [Eggerthellaceae bacterium]
MSGRGSSYGGGRRKGSGSARPSGGSSSSSNAYANVASVVASSGLDARILVVLALFLLLAVAFFCRLFYLQVIVADEYVRMAEESRTIQFETTPRRGTIYDRNGNVLAISVDATTIYANPVEVTDPVGEAAQLASILGGEVEDYQAILSNTSTTFVYIKRQAEVELADQVKAMKLPGVYFIADTRREYPNGSIGGQVIGYCNVDGVGITGLELQYNSVLKGTPGTYMAERGEDGLPIPGGVRVDEPAIDGTDIMVSLDIKMQDAMEQALLKGCEQMGTGGGSSVLMDASTGEIYATCSLPYMNPANMAESEIGSDQVKAITQQFEPDSIFKTVSILSVLENEVMAPEDKLFCPAEIEADGYVVSDAHERDDATFTLREIFDQSSNVGVSLATEKMGFDALYENILQYNLNERTGVDYPGEGSGYMQDFGTWARITGYNVSFGQGISVTPLQIVRLYGAIANDGVEVTPHFLVSKPQTGELIRYESELVVDNVEALDTMKSMLRSVVTDGTGTKADIEGYDVVGKTSTAEIAEGGVYKKGIYNLCFTGFIDNSTSNLVCFVGANEVYGMASVAHIFRDIMTFAIDQYNISPE